MGRTLVGCILANTACIALCGALLMFYPKDSGFTVTTPTSTHYLAGGELLAGALLCAVNFAIGVISRGRYCIGVEAFHRSASAILGECRPLFCYYCDTMFVAVLFTR